MKKQIPLLAVAVLLHTPFSFAETLPPDTVVYYSGGRRGHREGCPRFDVKTANPEHKMTLAEMEAKGGLLCSRCPGSTTPRKPKKGSKKSSRGVKDADLLAELGLPTKPNDEYAVLDPTKKRDKSVMRKGGNARKARLEIPEKYYDPNTIVYADALYMRVHAEDSPALILKEYKRTMTLEQADREGYRIGESGQSGRALTSFEGYRRKYPLKLISKDAYAYGNDNPKHKKHQLGCHRFWLGKDNQRKTIREWEAEGASFCPHCIEYGPSLATVSPENLEKYWSPGEPFTPPEGWEPMAFSPDRLPPQSEIDLLVKQTRADWLGVQELPFDDPVASLEQFMTMRFFFPVSTWLNYYQVYRATGDKGVLERLRGSARHYTQLSKDYPIAAQLKGNNPEGWTFLYSMAASARFTLQLAVKYPDQVTPEEIAEAEDFLDTIAMVLKPTLEDNSNLNTELGIPQKMVEGLDGTYNRNLNGVGTLSMTLMAMKDAQSLGGHSRYQSSIDRYTNYVKAFVSTFKNNGFLSTALPGKPMFVYPYSGKHTKVKEGARIYNRYEDAGHYSHSLQGLMLIHENTPELGVDEAFMTAIANAIIFNYTTKLPNGEYSAHIQCPVSKRIAPQGGEKIKHHPFKRGPGSGRFYMLEAFQPGVIDALNTTAKEDQKLQAAKNNRVKILHVHYLKALRKDPSLIHLGEAM